MLPSYRIRVLAVPPSELRREVQTGFSVHWAKTAKFLGRNKKVQTGIPHFTPKGGGTASTRIREMLQIGGNLKVFHRAQMQALKKYFFVSLGRMNASKATRSSPPVRE